MRKHALGIIISVLVFIGSNGITLAVSMESPRFQIDNANFNSASGDKSSSGYQLSDTIGQTAAGRFSSTGYIVRAGFQYIHSIIPFQFSISDININLGTLVPSIPSTAATVLSVSFGSAGQYQVTAIEEGPLKTLNEANSIDDTTCNGGAETCDESTAKLWDSNSAYGFGYNMDGNDIPADFTSTSYFRPFPDRTAPEPAAIVMSSVDVGRDRQATMTFKANISPVQPLGSYQTVVNFVATPGF
jgi:hypothetical protein